MRRNFMSQREGGRDILLTEQVDSVNGWTNIKQIENIISKKIKNPKKKSKIRGCGVYYI